MMIISLAWLTCFIFLFFFANSLGMLVAAEVLCGIPWGKLHFLHVRIDYPGLTQIIRSSPDIDNFICFRGRTGRSSRLCVAYTACRARKHY